MQGYPKWLLKNSKHSIFIWNGLETTNKSREEYFVLIVQPLTKRQMLIKNLLGVPDIKQFERYLVLPSHVGRNKRERFTNTKERVWRKFQGWGEKLLSQVRGLIKSVVQAIPIFTMSSFKIPFILCQYFKGLILKFWWGNVVRGEKPHWVKWENICKSKMLGGMGFKVCICSMKLF